MAMITCKMKRFDMKRLELQNSVTDYGILFPAAIAPKAYQSLCSFRVNKLVGLRAVVERSLQLRV